MYLVDESRAVRPASDSVLVVYLVGKSRTVRPVSDYVLELFAGGGITSAEADSDRSGKPGCAAIGSEEDEAAAPDTEVSVNRTLFEGAGGAKIFWSALLMGAARTPETASWLGDG